MDLEKLAKPEKAFDPLNGGSIVEELTGRFTQGMQYPFDGGNMDDYYLNNIIGTEDLRDRIRERMESSRAEALVML